MTVLRVTKQAKICVTKRRNVEYTSNQQSRWILQMRLENLLIYLMLVACFEYLY